MTTDNSDQAAAIGKLGEMIKDIRVAMLTTAAHDGSLHSRPMATQQAEFDSNLWFFTQSSTHKVAEIKDDQHVNVSYCDAGENRYVSITGTASIVRDRVKIEELWSPLNKAWFPKGLEDPEIALIKVRVEQAAYWDTPSSTMVQLVGFVKALATGEQFQPGEHQEFTFET
jgi:general stress protein 26